MNNSIKYVFWPEWKDVVCGLDGKTVSQFCFDGRRTYAHVHAVAKDLVSRGLFITSKSGRNVVYSLTEQGNLVRELLLSCDKLLLIGGGRR